MCNFATIICKFKIPKRKNNRKENRKMKKRNIILAALLLAGGSAFAQKLSTSTMLLLQQQTTQNRVKAANEQKVNVFITISAADGNTSVDELLSQLEALGVEIHNVVDGKYITSSMPISAIEAVSQIEAVENIQVGTEARMLLDKARSVGKVDDCHSTTSSLGAYTGKGVVVGIVDGGFQYSHVDFMKADGSGTRIARVWDQNAKVGKAPEKYNYGVEYTTFDEMKDARYDLTSTFHGTHVAGIAAGGDRTTSFYGVAPDAELVFVSFGQDNVSIADGIQYCFDYAKSVGKPCVVNISLGSHLGPHDGTSVTDRMFAEMVGPGKIIVGAAGNEGADDLHVSKTFTSSDKELKTLIGLDSNNKSAVVDIWSAKNAKLSVKAVVVDRSSGDILKELAKVSSDGSKTGYGSTSSSLGIDGAVSLALQRNTTNGRTNVQVLCSCKSIDSNRGIGIIVESDEGTTVNMWNHTQGGTFTDGGLRGWTSGDTDCTVGELGGVSPDVISVGSFNTKLSFKNLSGQTDRYDTWSVGKMNALSYYSSHGPTADGRTKPDVTAPGCRLISATSRYYSSFAAGQCAAKSGSDYYDAMMGTSMASPFVAGTVALWLQANPNLTPLDVLTILRRTSMHDQFTGTEADCDPNLWGAGKINAFEGLKIAGQVNAIHDNIAAEQMFSITTNRATRTAQFFYGVADGNASMAVYNAMGQLVYAKQLSTSGETVDLSQLGNGVFVVKLQQGNTVKTVKTAL